MAAQLDNTEQSDLDHAFATVIRAHKRIILEAGLGNPDFAHYGSGNASADHDFDKAQQHLLEAARYFQRAIAKADGTHRATVITGYSTLEAQS